MRAGQNDFSSRYAPYPVTYSLPGAHLQADEFPDDLPEQVDEAPMAPRPRFGEACRGCGIWARGVRRLLRRPGDPVGIWVRTRIQAGAPERRPAMHAYDGAYHEHAQRHAPRGKRRVRLEGASHRVIASCPLEKGEPRGKRAQGRKMGTNLPNAERERERERARERERLYRYTAVAVIPVSIYSERGFCVSIYSERERKSVLHQYIAVAVVPVSICSYYYEDATSTSQMSGYERTHLKPVAEGRPAEFHASTSPTGIGTLKRDFQIMKAPS